MCLGVGSASSERWLGSKLGSGLGLGVARADGHLEEPGPSSGTGPPPVSGC